MIHQWLEQWHQVVAGRDLARLADCLADDVVFFSPVVHTPQHGKTTTLAYLSAAFLVFGGGEFSYVQEVSSGSDAVLEFTTQIQGIEVNGVDMIHWNDEGKISSFKVMIRPLKAIHLIHQLMGEQLSRSTQVPRSR